MHFLSSLVASKNKFGIVKCHETQYPFKKPELIIFNTSAAQSCIDYQRKKYAVVLQNGIEDVSEYKKQGNNITSF